MLLNIYEFTQEDLKANQNGSISAGQNAWLQSIARGVVKSSRRTFPIGIAFALFGACLILAMFLQNESTRALLFSGPDVFIGLIVALIAVTGLLGLAIFISRRNAKKLQSAQLQSIQGEVSIDQNYSSESGLTSYYLKIGKKKFAFGDDPSSVFKEGGKYRLYYFKAGAYEMILSYDELES
jgi:hypothetical protein